MARRSALLVAAVVVGAVGAVTAVTRAHAQTASPPVPGLRTAFDDNNDSTNPDRTKKRRNTDSTPVGEVPAYGIAPGTGKTGFTSAPRRKTKAGTKTAPKAGDPIQLSGAPPAPPKPPPPLPVVPEAAKKAQANLNIPGTSTPGLLSSAPGGAPASANSTSIAPLPPPYVLPPRKKPIAELDPFEQVGIRAGAFLVKPAIEVSEGYNTNPAAVPGGKGSWFTLIAPELAVQSQWQRHELTATIRGSFTDYASASSQNRPFVDARVNGRIDVDPRTRIDVEGRYLLSTDYPGSPDLPAGVAKLPIFTDVGASLGGTQKFNRFEVMMKGTIDRVEYDNAKLLDGSSVSQKDRDYDQYGGVLRGSYELTPGVKPFVEADADIRNHDLPVDASGVQRDSHGLSGRVGTTFEISRMLTGEVSIGYLTRTYKDPTLPDLNGLLFDASLVWVATGLTNVKFIASTRADESTVAGVSGVLRHDYSVQVDHAFRRWLIGTLKFGTGFDDYVGSTREDKRYVASGAIVYKLDRAWQVKAEVREEWLRSNVSGVDYAATIMTLGLRWQP